MNDRLLIAAGFVVVFTAITCIAWATVSWNTQIFQLQQDCQTRDGIWYSKSGDNFCMWSQKTIDTKGTAS